MFKLNLRLHLPALLYLDAILLPFALFTSVMLRLGGEWDTKLNTHLWLFFLLPLWTIPIFINLGLYKAVIKYLDEKIVFIVFFGVSLSVLILISIIDFLHYYAFPKSAIIIFWVVALAYIGGSRLILRGVLRRLTSLNNNKINVAIYGAGSAGIQICIALQNSGNYQPVAFVDDNATLWNNTIRGINVYNPKNLATLIKQKNIAQVLLAIPSLSYNKRRQIINFLEPLSIKIKTLPTLTDLINGNVTVNHIKAVEIEDLLGRSTIIANEISAKEHFYINNKNILITGAGGSIGSELVRQISNFAPKILVLLDISEFALYAITQQLAGKNLALVTTIGSACDEVLISQLLDKYKINHIFHAAAYKHVPLVEANPIVGIYNNVFSTLNLAKLAQQHQVERMILISTDKAVRPTNIMGASKRLAEIILQAFNQQIKQNNRSHLHHDEIKQNNQIHTDQQGNSATTNNYNTIFTMVRFGNVLDSSGSVVPLFREQIRQGNSLTVTHPDVIRYFMTIAEAVQLVLQAANLASGGDVFVLDMGEPVKIADLAAKMIHLSGLTIKNQANPDGDIAIKFIGLRPGEKLYEELLIGNNPQQTTHPLIMRANEKFLDYQELLPQLEQLKHLLANYQTDQAINLVKTLIAEKI